MGVSCAVCCLLMKDGELSGKQRRTVACFFEALVRVVSLWIFIAVNQVSCR